MKLINYKYKNLIDLEKFIDINGLNTDVFIQIFSGELDTTVLQPILDFLTKKIPSSSIIGASTAGEIVNGKIDRVSIQISFSLFDDVDIQMYYCPKSDFDHGVKAARKIVSEDTKVAIAFSEALKGDSESFLDGFSSINKDIPIAGGNAGDNFKFEKTFIIHDNTIYFDGMIIATLNSKNLHVSSQYSLEWTRIGKEMLITKADNNVVYEIDNKPVQEIYAHYLGEESVENIPASAIEFPLVKVSDNTLVARSMVGKSDDGGYIFAGHFKNGESVRFAIGNIEEVLNNAGKLQDKISRNPVEATYIYSCSVRDLFIKDELNYEFGLIEEIAPTVGMFTYGEFYHSKSKNQLLNITTTTLSLSESTNINMHKKSVELKHKQSMLKSLINLVNTTQYELSDNLNLLNQYKSILDKSSIVSKTDIKGVITYVNDSFCEMSGYSKEELIGQKHNLVKHDDTDTKIFKDMWKTISSKKVWRGTIKNRAKDGSEYYVKSVIMPILDEKDDIVEYIAARIDVTELVKKDQIIKEQYTDPLTGMQNRESFISELNSGNDNCVLVLLNIDRFSDINDYFGYEIGDSFLKMFSKKIQSNIEDNAKAYKIGIDEFAVLYPKTELGDMNKDEVIEFVSNLEHNRCEVDPKNSISIVLSCGVACGMKNDIYKLAHVAMKEAKRSHEKIVFYNESEFLQENIKNNIEIINTIKSAIDEDRFIPFYQGIVDNKSKKIVKYESLIRLKERDGKIVSPFFFLEHSKKSKFYNHLTRIMIRKTFEKFATLDYEFSINLSLQDVQSKETRAMLSDYLNRYKCGDRLVLEIVESEGIENFDELLSFIDEVKAHGCKIAIDDFGTGYSNFVYLSKLNIDYIKIDGSLVKNIDTDMTQRVTVESILHFAKKMNIKTIAEYVENESIYNTLVELGVDFSQGYYFSVPSEEL